MTFAEFREYHRVPARKGMAVEVDGKLGVIASIAGCGNYLGVRFVGARPVVPCHPRWRVTYHISNATTVRFGD